MKTMTKRFGVAALLVAVLLSMTACGAAEPADDQATPSATQPTDGNSAPDSQMATPLFFDGTKYTGTEEAPYEYAPGDYSIARKYALKGTPDFEIPTEMSLDGTPITFMHTTVKELLSKGWTLETGTKAGDTVSATSICKAVVKTTSGKYAMVYAGTADKAAATFENCVITDVNVSYDATKALYYNGETDGADFALSSALKRTSVAADVVSKLGNPTNITITEWYKNDQHVESTITISYDEYQSANGVGATFEFLVNAQTSTMKSVRVTVR
ncbi:MAG: hypothetical protein E7527_04950 [Ruminococcaceae bacterium]|nr:hypothetical protein [Oscillospiraceae bacterium]